MLADLPVDLTDASTAVADADVSTGDLAYDTGVDAAACLALDLEHESRLALHVDVD